MMLGASCGNPAPKAPPVAPPPSNPGVATDEVHIKNLDLVRKSTDAKNERLWSVKAEWGTVEYSIEGAFGGRMKTVTGQIFQDDKPTSEFKADFAEADKASNTLTLEGNIMLVSLADKSTLKCVRLQYFADRDVIEAAGPVTVGTPSYDIGPFDKVFARGDLSLVATPDYFKDKDEKH